MPSAILINYNLKSTSKQYGPLVEKIKSYGTWCNLGGSVWVVVTTQTTAQVQQALTPYIASSGEQLICIDVTNAAWTGEGYTETQFNWLKQNLPQRATSRW
jgi:hypothetical protein